MEKETEHFILDMLARHFVLTLATNREDGWPQANTVCYVNEGMVLYIMTAAHARKVHNIERDPRVSLSLNAAEQDLYKIKGLSMAAMAEIVTQPGEKERVVQMMGEKYPQLATGKAEGLVVLRLTPKVISVLNYEKGFGNTEVIEM